MKIRRGFRGDVTPYLPSWSSAFHFAHVCMLHAKQVKQVKQMKQMKQTASKTRFKEPTRVNRGGVGWGGDPWVARAGHARHTETIQHPPSNVLTLVYII